MRRREFIAGVGSAAAWPLAARAQQAAMPVVGWLGGRTPKTDALILRGFQRGLEAQGYVEGRNVTVEYRWADGDDSRVPALAADLLRRPLAVVLLVGVSTRSMMAVIKEIDSKIPILFDSGGDPVNAGLVSNFNRPGGNLTGVVGMLPLLGSKRLERLHDLLPRATTIAFLVPSTFSQEVADVQTAARLLGLQVRILNVGNERELDAAFTSFAEMRPDALLVGTSPFFFTRTDKVVAAAAKHEIPTVYFRREFAAAGGLMSYGANTDENHRVLGEYAGRILKGEKPGNLPVQQPTKFELVINMKTAKALGLTIPETLLAPADELIE